MEFMAMKFFYGLVKLILIIIIFGFTLPSFAHAEMSEGKKLEKLILASPFMKNIGLNANEYSDAVSPKIVFACLLNVKCSKSLGLNLSNTKSYLYPNGYLFPKSLNDVGTVIIGDVAIEAVEYLVEKGLSRRKIKKLKPGLVPITRGIPEEVVRDVKEFSKTDGFKKCSANQKLSRLVQRDNSLKMVDKLVTAYFLAERHSRICMTDVTSDHWEWVNRLVIIYSNQPNSQSIPICTGFAVEKNLIVTAAHCFNSSQEEDLNLSNIIFMPLWDTSKALKGMLVNNTKKLEAGVPSAKDFVEINLIGSNIDFPTFSVIKPMKWQRLYIADTRGLGLSDLQETSDLPIEEKMKYLSQKVRLDAAPSCFVADTVENWLFHACQTNGGNSGTPLIVKSGGKFSLVGIHNGAIRETHIKEKFVRPEIFPNYGITYPRDFGS